MIIALDFDDTFTEDPMLWQLFVEKAKERLHSITFVTYRDSRWGNSDIEGWAEILDIPIVFTAGKQKEHCFAADVWIDDNVATVASYKSMVDMVKGCESNNDVK